MKIDLIDNAPHGVTFKVTLELIEEMAESIHNCTWVSSDEISAYMKACITNGSYEPEEWSEEGKGLVAIDRDIIK